jgi:nicotinamidase/pyrazinamidase
LVARNVVYWEVDVQIDFMLPHGKLYVSGAEKIIPKLDRLVEAARQRRVLLVSSADAHNADDPELREWPPHCLKGSPGAELLSEACAPSRLVIPNEKEYLIPRDVTAYQQVTLLKNTLDVFDNPNTDALLAMLNPGGAPAFDLDLEFVVFGVATEYCVRCTAAGLLRRNRRVAIVTDAIQAINPEKGRLIVEELQSCGARLISTDQALSLIGPTNAPSA